jgi:hypothetical protein
MSPKNHNIMFQFFFNEINVKIGTYFLIIKFKYAPFFFLNTFQKCMDLQLKVQNVFIEAIKLPKLILNFKRQMFMNCLQFFFLPFVIFKYTLKFHFPHTHYSTTHL